MQIESPITIDSEKEHDSSLNDQYDNRNQSDIFEITVANQSNIEKIAKKDLIPDKMLINYMKIPYKP